MYCKHCNVPRSYYINNTHAGRRSCRDSESGYHSFSVHWCTFISLSIIRLLTCRTNKQKKAVAVVDTKIVV